MQVKDLTTDELKALIRETVLQTIEELLPDPDVGLTVKSEFQESLMAIRNRRETEAVDLSATEVAHQLGSIRAEK